MLLKKNVVSRLLLILLLFSSIAMQAQVLDRKQAEDLINQGEYVKALDIYKNINAKKITLESTLDLARTYKMLRNHDESEKFFRMATRYPECPADAFCDLGDMLMFNGKYDEARQVYFTYATRGGDPNIARIRIFSCDSAYAISKRPPFYSVANERRINTKYSEFCASANGNYFVFTSDRPIDYKSTDAEELSATLSMLQGAGSDVATLLLLRNAQDPTDVEGFNKKNASDTLNVVHSIYEGDEFDVSSEKEKSKRRSKEQRERKQMEKLREKKKKTYGGTGRPYLNMYLTSRQPKADNPGRGVLGNFVWTAPVLLPPPLNTGEHSGPCTFTPDGNTMYFCFSELLSDANTKTGSNVSHVGIMISHKSEEDDGNWTVPVFFPYNKRSDYSVGHPCITKDGQTIYFASNMPGTIGGQDIFKCDLQSDGTWGAPENLGPIINTIRDEQFPTLDSNDVLYFSSDGHPGLGGLDIFKAKGKPGAWTGVENLRKPVNSSSDDFSFVFLPGSKTQGVFSSNRPGGYGDDDIYSFKLASEAKPEPKGKPLITITVVNRIDSSPIEGVQLTLMNIKTKKGEVMTSDGVGKAYFAVAPKSFYNLSSQVAGYLPSEIEGINTNKIKPGESIKVTLPLDPLAAGGSFKIDNVYYDYGKAVLKKAAFKELDKVVKFMETNPGVKIELSSHTDSRGGLAGNMRLSQQRAESCVKYLIKKGVSSDRIVPKGYGPTKPLIKNAKTEKQHAKNRRTEIKILEVK